MDIPLDPESSPHMILFDDGTALSVPVASLPELIPKPIVNSTDTLHLLPPFLQIGSKITLKRDGPYHKGLCAQSPDWVYCFSYKSHINKKHKDWGIPLLNLTTTWHDLCIKGILLPGHSSLTFQCLPGTSTLANHVSAVNLTRDCPCSLLPAVNLTHPDQDAWLASFRGEKSGTESQNGYLKWTLAKYRALQQKGAPHAILTMCVINPLWAKSRIVALGHHEDSVWSKSKKYAPVLCPDSMRLMVSMAVQKHRTLHQGDCKNAFCQGIFPTQDYSCQTTYWQSRRHKGQILALEKDALQPLP